MNCRPGKNNSVFFALRTEKPGMMNRLFVFLLVLVLCNCMAGQVDSVQLNNGLRSKIKVISIEENSVFYLIPGDSSNQVRSINKSEISKLWLNTKLNKETGQAGSQAPSFSNTKNKKQPLSEFSKNYIGFNMGSMIFTSVSFSYLRLISDGTLGVRFFGGDNLNPQQLQVTGDGNGNYFTPVDFIASHKKSTLGIEFDLFPLKQRKVAYYLGPSFQFSRVDCLISQGNYYGGWTPPEKFNNAANISFILNNGFLCRFTNNFYLDLSGGIGIQRIDFGSLGDVSRTRTSLQLLIGYSF
jgi:hypothetical protein